MSDQRTAPAVPVLAGVRPRPGVEPRAGRSCVVMGVVNVTSDSFSDGGRYLDPDRAIEHGVRLHELGADIIDVGGESTRPGAVRVDVETGVHSPVPLWVSPGGVVSTVPPQTASEAAVAGWLTAIVTSALVTGIVYVSWKGFVHLMNRRRYEQWAREWDEVEPRMSGRTRDR